MNRLALSKPDSILPEIPDEPDNCSTLFLLHRPSSTIWTDNHLKPKFIIVTYPETNSPRMYFSYGTATRKPAIIDFIQKLDTPADLVVPQPLVPLIGKYWPIQFAVSIYFLAANNNWQPQPVNNQNVRLLHPDDIPKLTESFKEHPWLWEFFGDPSQLIHQGQAAAAFINGELASVATTLAYTQRFCELGVATRPEYRGYGLALECCRYLSKTQYEEFRRLPCWRTHIGNLGSRKIAMELGLSELKNNKRYLFLSNYRHIGRYATVAP